MNIKSCANGGSDRFDLGARLRKFVTGAVAGGAAGGVLFWLCQGWQMNLRPVGMDYNDLAATLLAASALLVTILGVFVAVLAIWGYTQFEKMAKDTTKSYIQEQLKDGKLKDDVESLVSKHIKITEDLVREELIKSITARMEHELSEGRIRTLLEERLDLALYTGAAQRAAAQEKREEEKEDEVEDDIDDVF